MEQKTDWKTLVERMTPKKQQLLILLLIGVLLAVIALPVKKPEDDPAEERERREDVGEKTGDYAAEIEQRLKETLEYVAGVGRVEVMITLRSTAEKVIEKDQEKTDRQMQETDAKGGERTTLDDTLREETIYNGGEGAQSPYVKKEMTPEIEGVIVIAQGGGNPSVIRNITEAVQALFDVDTHKIKIMKMNQRK